MQSGRRKKHIKRAVSKIKSKTGSEPKIGLVLGSGLGELADEIKNPGILDFPEIPHFPVSSVKGHRGQVVAGELCGKSIIALAGRIHFYEGYSMQQVVFPVEVMAGCGIKKIIITNAGGGINSDYRPGDIVIIKDHINLMGDNPLKGSADFIDMTRAYDPALISLALQAGSSAGLILNKGVYAAMQGPSYETPAEIEMLRRIGADIAGMSTVPEVIAANKKGLKVLGLSMITNMAAGITGESLSHDEVIETTEKSKEKFKMLVKKIIEKM